MVYTPILPNTPARPAGTVYNDILGALRLNFSVTTWVLLGAALQGLAVYAYLPARYTLLLAVFGLAAKLTKAVLETYNVLPNPYMKDVFKGRSTALLPTPDDAEILEPSGGKIVVFVLGAKSNHPFGMFAPQFTKVGEWLTKMVSFLNAGDAPGFLGLTSFDRHDERGAPEAVIISYWRSVEDLWEFAHGGVHRECWTWWEQTIKENDCVGVHHEIYEVDAKHWENVYINFQPTLMGATSYLKKGGKTVEGGRVPDEFVSPLVDARRGKLAKSSARMGRAITGYDTNRVAAGVYGEKDM